MIKLSIVIPVYNQEKLVICALNSIPKRKDLELIIIDDYSTDNTFNNVQEWCNNYKDYFYNIISIRNSENRGVGFTKNLAYKLASGEYIHTIDSDDYVYTEQYSLAIDKLYEAHSDNEILILDHKDNGGTICTSSSCNATWRYFIKLKFLRDNNLEINPIYRRAEDWFLMRDIEKLRPKFKRLGILAYHYNYPREGSLTWNWNKYGRV